MLTKLTDLHAYSTFRSTFCGRVIVINRP